MLTLKLISEETERVVKGLEKKCFPNAREAVEKVLEYDRLRRGDSSSLDANKQRQNQLSREIGGLMKSGKRDEANQVKEQVAQLKAADKALQEVMQKAQADMNEVTALPSLGHTHPTRCLREPAMPVAHHVGEGRRREARSSPTLLSLGSAEEVQPRRFRLGVKITGAGFPVSYRQDGASSASLEAFFLDEARKSGYTEVQPPSWSMRPADWARASSPTRRARCTMPTSTTST